MRSIDLILLTLLAGRPYPTSTWTYRYPERWPNQCIKGKSQSPINLQEKLSRNFTARPFYFMNYKQEYFVTLTNTGTSAVINLAKGQEPRPSVTGGALNKIYVLENMHFHWESEHTINGRRFPLELHAIHYNSRYKSFSEARKNPDGVAVFGVLFELSPDDLDDLDIATDIMLTLSQKRNVAINISSPIRPMDYFPSDTAGYFRYPGSITAPDCEEVVIWTIFTNKLALSQRQVNFFYMIARDTYRPLQEINGRVIYWKESPLIPINCKGKLTINVFLIMVSISSSFFF